ncbi:hypothetical protein [Methylocella sp.]|jgi:hypothetical protein|uniref:hypothetical protein n=1 Tax=Methylocella sp. TaxID=1978226 RepID=UPI003C733200
MSERLSIDAADAGRDAVSRQDPVVRSISIEDMAEAFAQGLRDFQSAPGYGLVFDAIFAGRRRRDRRLHLRVWPLLFDLSVDHL